MAAFGDKNGNWKGGVSEYPNHSEMKRVRLVKLQQTKGLCEICGDSANQIHHKDGSKDDHAIENLIVLCRRCHTMTDIALPRHTSKFIRKYGMTLNDMTEKYGGSAATWQRLDNEGRLTEFLTSSNQLPIVAVSRYQRTSKYQRRYGLTVRQIAARAGISMGTCYALARRNELDRIIKKHPSLASCGA